MRCTAERRAAVLLMVLVASSALAGALGAVDSVARGLLVGWTGDGKSYFCNTFDGTVCEQPKGYQSGEHSSTSSTYFGMCFVDTIGFGDNRKNGSVTTEQASVLAIGETLRAVNGTLLRAVVWIVPCAERKAKDEALRLMSLLSQMLGRPVPIVAVFNPAHPTNECVKNPKDFVALAVERGVAVSEVVHIRDFKMEQFKSKYSMPFRVMVPWNLTAILHSLDPVFLANQMQRLRELECERLPSHLAGVRENATALEASVRSESSLAVCVREACVLGQPQLSSCTRNVCAEEGQDCPKSCVVGRVFCKTSCYKYCKRYTQVEDLACQQSNQVL